MPTLTMTVAKIEPPKPGKQKAKVVGVAGETIYAFPDKAAKFTPGRAYEVDYSTNEWNGKTFNNLESFHEVEASRAQPASITNGNGYHSKDEQIFVQGVLQAMIRGGLVKAATKDELKQELWSATQMLRGLWKHTFGYDSVHQHLEAAE
jgi:hypothetical protein